MDQRAICLGNVHPPRQQRVNVSLTFYSDKEDMDYAFKKITVPFLLFFLIPRPLIAINCKDLLITVGKIEQIRTRIQETKGVHVLENVAIMEGFSAAYKRHEREIALAGTNTNLWKRIYLHHEAVHMTTDVNFRKNPTSENAALAIIFKNAAPEPYTELQLDEVKAYSKSSKLVSTHARFWKESGLESSDEMNKWAIIYKSFAQEFHKISKQLLLELRSEILACRSGGKQLNMTGSKYAKDTPDHYVLEITLNRPSAPTIIVPIFDKTVRMNGGVLSDPYPKLLEICNAGIKVLEDLSKDIPQ